MNEFLKPIVKKLNNFKFTALLCAIGGAVSVILTILLFVFYARSGLDGNGNVTIAFNYVKGVNSPSIYIVGMIYFLICIVSLIVGIVIVALSFPFIFPKDKMTPKKSLPWLMVANGAIHFALIIMVIYLITSEFSRMKVGYIIYIIVGALLLIYSLLFILPGLKCRFYMPQLNNPEENK